MPDLGRWNRIDQLAESYLSTTPYAYVANNPISNTDPDGRWINEDGTIDTSRRTPGFTSGRQMYSQFLGYRPGDGGGGGDVAALLARAGSLGGTWNNTGFGFMDGDGTLLGYDGSYKSLNANFEEGGIGDAVINIPAVNITGSLAIDFGLQMRNHVNGYMAGWNAQSDLAWKKWSCPQCFDGPIQYIGSAGDPAGVFDIGGQVISTWKPENRYLAMGAGILAAVALRKPGLATAEESNLWKIGAYKEMRGLEKGLDAHHVGQSAVMKKLVAGYDHKLAPTILVQNLGDTIGTGVVSRSTSGFTSARQVVARDIFELRRVYKAQGIPNSALQELIQMNKTMYPEAFLK